MTLEEFLRCPWIDKRPYLEYFDGRIEAKASAQTKRCVIQLRVGDTLNRFAEPSRLGLALPELRRTFAGRSIIPGVVFLLDANIQCHESSEFVDETTNPPDIRPPEPTIEKTREKLAHSVAHGCPLGWCIDPYRRTVDVYPPGLPPERLPADAFLDGEPVLPGFRIPIAEVFGWLTYRVRKSDTPGAGHE
jgi:Uma2 family endonuclease